jgi:hypothetical protein
MVGEEPPPQRQVRRRLASGEGLEFLDEVRLVEVARAERQFAPVDRTADGMGGSFSREYGGVPSR